MLTREIEWFRDWVIELIPYRPLRLLIVLVVFFAVLAVLLLVVRFVFGWVDRKLSSWKGRWLRSIRWRR